MKDIEKLRSPRGVFSEGGMPLGWKRDPAQRIEANPYVREIATIIPDGTIISEIPRSSNSITFVVQTTDGLRVCQFGPQITDADDNKIKNERLNPKKFEGIKSRFDHLKNHEVAVPRIFSTGTSKDLQRTFVVMEYVKGISADKFLSSSPEQTSDVFFKAGAEIGRLASIPLFYTDVVNNDAQLYTLHKQKNYLDFLRTQHVLTDYEATTIYDATFVGLSQVGNTPCTYVHTDPWPVNWQITGNKLQNHLTLLDLEAIQIGHPLVEGLGRMLQWSGRDWFHLQGQTTNARANENQIINGFTSQVRPDVLPLNDPTSWVDMLCNVSELVWLPKGITFELLKDHPQESHERRKKNMLDLAEKVYQHET